MHAPSAGGSLSHTFALRPGYIYVPEDSHAASVAADPPAVPPEEDGGCLSLPLKAFAFRCHTLLPPAVDEECRW